jgi:3D (Asp-Asp-Asp) domain-containing protein
MKKLIFLIILIIILCNFGNKIGKLENQMNEIENTTTSVVIIDKEEILENTIEEEIIETSPEGETELEQENIDMNLEYLGIYTLTAYCSCEECCGKSDGITASGVKARPNHTIAAPSEFAFGTKLMINGIEYTVEDRGGAIKDNRIDVYFDSHQEAINFGKQKNIDVYRISEAD